MNDGQTSEVDVAELETAPTELPPAPPAKKRRGFACLSVERRTEIARLGGAAVQATGKTHRFTKETASAAGKKGVLARRARKECAA